MADVVTNEEVRLPVRESVNALINLGRAMAKSGHDPMPEVKVLLERVILPAVKARLMVDKDFGHG